MSDLTERLRNATYMDDVEHLCALAADALEAAEAKLAAIDGLHRYSPDSDGCFECFRLWPCPAHLILHPGEEA